MFDVDFDSETPQVICHRDYAHLVPTILKGLTPYELKNHFILFSSGTTGGALKGYALSKTALLANARAVNEHFALTKEDVWGLSLPVYHVGGLSVLARAYLLGNRIVDGRKWNPQIWLEKFKDVTITTLVPTQLYDLVKLKLSPSKNLRYAVIGGDFLSSRLKEEALELGWPVIRTFGMSEVSSQLASAKTSESDHLEVLPIHQIKIHEDKLCVRSEALFTLEFILGDNFEVNLAKDLCDSDGFYVTKDRAEIDEHGFKHLGRAGDEFKISGHLVNFITLRDQLASFLLERHLYQKMEFSLMEDVRKGKKLVLFSSVPVSDDLFQALSKTILPVKIDEVRLVESFNRTALGKLKK